MALDDALAAWRSVVGEDRVLTAAAASDAYGACTTGDERRLAGALHAASREEVCRIVEIAAQHRVALYPISAGRNWGYGCALPVQHGCVLLDLSRLAGIRNFDPELGVVTVEPGVTQGMLATFLEARKAPYLVPVSGAGPNASILGNALERGYGITPVADHFLAVQSLEAVLPDGRLYRPALASIGGEHSDQAFKWGVGPYLDGLFTQANFGIITAMTIALCRRPESAKAFFFGLRDEQALSPIIDVLRQVLQRLPGLVGGVNLMNRHRVLAMAAPFPRELIGPDGMLTDIGVAQLARRYRIAAWTVFGTLYGTKRTVRAAQLEIRRLVGPKGRGLLFVSPAGATRLRRLAGVLPTKSGAALAQRTILLESSLNFVIGRPSEAALALAYWKSGRSRTGAAFGLDPSRDRCGVIWYTPLVVMKAEVVTRYVAFVTETMRRHQIEPLISLTTLSERCFDSSVPILFDRDDPAAVLRANTCYRALLDEGARNGFVPYRVGIGAMDWLVRPGIVAWDLVANIKRALDPFDIISPGRYAPSSLGM